VSASGQRICRLAERASAASSPDEALQIVRALREEIDDFERQHVARALTQGQPVTAIARALGVSRQSAHRRFRDLVPPRHQTVRTLSTPEAKLAIEYACREARELGSPNVAGEHVLLGTLHVDDCTAVQALNALGVTLKAARPAAQQVSAARREGPPTDDETRAILSGAMRASLDERVGIKHLLIGALNDPAGGAAKVLGVLGVEPETARSSLGAHREQTPELALE
jgi:ATP-dependent Clp protease ATP-binding subunit ClpA